MIHLLKTPISQRKMSGKRLIQQMNIRLNTFSFHRKQSCTCICQGLTLWKILGLSEAAGPLNTFQALKLEMEPDKLPSGSQVLDWHLTDENLFTHPGKMLQKCMWTDTWEKIDVKDRCRTFSRSYEGKIIGLFVFKLIYLKDFYSMLLAQQVFYFAFMY